MKNYLSEEVFLKDNCKKILYSDDTELGTEYIVRANGVFTEYYFINGACMGFRDISFNEFFNRYSKSTKVLLMICRVIRVEVFLALIVGFFIKRSVALGVLSSMSWLGSILDYMVIGGISFCLVKMVLNNKAYLVDVCRKILQLYVVINLGRIVISSLGGSNFTKVVVIIMVSLYIMAIAFSVNIKVNLNSLYDDLIVKYQD